MECDSAFRELASRNDFIRDLEEQGYLLNFINGYLVIYGLPYLDPEGALVHGDWISSVDLSADGVLDPPTDHQAWFRGARPHDGNRVPLALGGGANRIEVADGFASDQSFSFKLKEGAEMRGYRSFEEKVHTYLDIITEPAMAAYPEATPLRAIAAGVAEQDTPLKLPDTLSSRYHYNDLAMLLKGRKVAIIGLGGTGSYILDLLARTHLASIALYDDDKVHVHTLFRFPGHLHRAIGTRKVNALAHQYGHWHGGIEPIPERVTSTNIEQLGDRDFVFISLDHGPSRVFIADWLSARGIPFVDCGMGLDRAPVGLNGMVRITGVDRAAFDQSAHSRHLPSADPEGGEYRRQGQIAELNALNATLAVIRFKQHFGIYDRVDESVSYVFETASFDLDKLAAGE